MIRVLMTGDTVGGVWNFTLELAQGLARHEVEIILAAMGGPPAEAQRACAARISNLRLLESHFKLEWMPEPWNDVEEAGRWLLGLEQKFSPDLIHLNSYGHGALPWRAPTVLTAHSCVLSWWAAVRGGEAPEEWNRYRDLVARSLRSVDLVTAPTQAMLLSIRRHYGDFPRGRVVWNGREPSRFRRGPKSNFILSAGRLWDEAKNIRALDRVAPELAWPVYVAGETGGMELRHCHPLGALSAGDLADWYARASVYALPAYYEPFGLSVLEAALSGCALVLGDIPSLREIWADAAVYVAPDDTGSLHRQISRLIADSQRRVALAERAYQRGLAFRADGMALHYFEAYQDALSARTACA